MIIQRYLSTSGKVKEARLAHRQAVSWLEVGVAVELGLQLISGRGLDHVNLAFGTGLVAKGHHPLAIR